MAKPKTAKNTNETPLETRLFQAADMLRNNIDAAEYKHIVLGLVFLKYISDSFDALHAKLSENTGTMNMPTRKSQTNTRRRMSFGFHKTRAGLIFMGAPDYPLSAKT